MKPLFTDVALKKLIDKLMTNLIPLAVGRKSLILNDVSSQLTIYTDENMLSFVLWNMITVSVNSTTDSCIHIEAVQSGDLGLIYVKDNADCHDIAIASNLIAMQQVAKKLGGYVSITGNQHKGTTMAFAFSNKLNAA